MSKYYIITLILCIGFVAGCKHYDSDAVNKRLLQGYWQLDGICYEAGDTIFRESIMDASVFLFAGDSCFLYQSASDTVLKYRYEIKNYRINAYPHDSLPMLRNTRRICLLTKDTLILGVRNIQWHYVKVDKSQPAG